MNEPFKEFSLVRRNNTLSAFIDESKTRLKEILKRLEWNIDPNIDTHIALKNKEQNETQLVVDVEPEFPPSCASENFIVTDAEELRTILDVSHKDVPKKFSDLQLNFSRKEKLTLYEHVITNTKKCTEPEITVQLQDEDALTFAEIVAQKKRETRKRRRYRRSKPTHIEEVRAVVELQMQSLQQYLKEKDREVQKYQLMNEKYTRRSTTNKINSTVQGSSRITHTSVNFCIKGRSRSRSYERKSHKKSRHRSRSSSNSHKHKKHKKNRSDRSGSKNRSCRSRSRSESKRQTHKRHNRSKRRSRSRSSSNNRNKPYHRQRRV